MNWRIIRLRLCRFQKQKTGAEKEEEAKSNKTIIQKRKWEKEKTEKAENLSENKRIRQRKRK